MALTAVAVIVSLITIVLNQSLPFRIGPEAYARYLWSERILFLAIPLTLGAVICAATARRHFLLGLSVVALLTPFGTSTGVHSGPNPEAWCYNHLRRIQAAKAQLAVAGGLTNGTSISPEKISKLCADDSGHFQCARNGHYIIGSVGTEPWCSVHGSMSETETAWQRK